MFRWSVKIKMRPLICLWNDVLPGGKRANTIVQSDPQIRHLLIFLQSYILPRPWQMDHEHTQQVNNKAEQPHEWHLQCWSSHADCLCLDALGCSSLWNSSFHGVPFLVLFLSIKTNKFFWVLPYFVGKRTLTRSCTPLPCSYIGTDPPKNNERQINCNITKFLY